MHSLIFGRSRAAVAAASSTLAVPLFLLIATSAVALAHDASQPRQVLHVLDRLAFGPSTEDFRRVSGMGIEAYIAEQLNPTAIVEPRELSERIGSLETLRLNPLQLMEQYGPPRPVGGVKPTPEERQAKRVERRIVRAQTSDARIWRALYSPRQLNEVMVDFWFNHFNVYDKKVHYGLWVGAYEEQAIRPHALGKFRDLLLATARHPAMLIYLDNIQNSAPGSKGANGAATGLNENYAREVMELHTLGVDGGYTQDDVVALARILTGWSFLRNPEFSPDGSGFRFKAQFHDDGRKRFLGRDIAPNGEAEGVEALTMLARSPATARHISFKLAQYFVADQPPPALVDRLVARFQETDGDIRAVLQALFASGEFRDSIGSKYKTPYRYVLSAVRAAGVPVRNTRPLQQQMAELGMPLYGCQTPDGYSDTADKWLSPDAGPKRVSFAVALASGGLRLESANDTEAAAPGRSPDRMVKEDPVLMLLQPILGEKTRAAIVEAPAGQRAALALGSPDFMRR